MLWAAPHYGWLALLLIPACLLARRAEQRRLQILLQLGVSGPPIKSFSGTVRRLLPGICHGAAFLMLVAALCRPQWGTQIEQQESPGLDILVALDVSRSMLADDLPPTRLAAAKKAITLLVDRLQGERVGLVAFAGTAFLVCPLTSDYADFRRMLDETGSDSIPRGGSDLASFQKEVLNGFAGIDAGSRLLILVSDGEDHGSTSETAARRLRESGLLICSVTAGSDKGSVIPLPGGNFLKNRDGEIVRSQANPAALEWFTPRNVRLDPGGTALVKLYDQVRPLLQKRSIKISRQRQVERFQFPLAAALLLLVLEPFFKGRRHT